MNNQAGQRAEDLLERTSYHEAGHAVIALVHGLEVGRVSVVPTETGRGFFDRTSRRLAGDNLIDDDADDATLAAELLLTVMAGMTAELTRAEEVMPWRLTKHPSFTDHLDDPDVSLAVHYAGLIDPRDPHAPIERAWELLKRLVDNGPIGRAVMAIARALRIDKEINGPEATSIINEHLAPDTAAVMKNRHARLAYVRGSGPWPPEVEVSSVRMRQRGMGSHHVELKADRSLVIDWYDFGDDVPYESGNTLTFSLAGQRALARAMDLPPVIGRDLQSAVAERFAGYHQVRAFCDHHRVSYAHAVDWWP
jgi:hypothetical protein